MYISVPWAIALAVAGVLAVVIVLAFAAQRGVVAAPERALAHVAHLLGGGVAGFLALAFPPAWPALAAVVGMLIIQAARTRRALDIGLLMAGFGSTWALLGSLAVLNDMADPAVTSPGAFPRFVIGVGILVAGVLMAVLDSMRKS